MLFRSLNQKGTTIFLTTQYMEEADNLCERLAIIDNGKIVAEGTPEHLKEEIGGDTITLEIKDSSNSGVTSRDNAVKTLTGLPNIKDIKVLDNNRLSLNAANGSYIIPEIVSLLQEQNIVLGRLEFANSSLDDVFLKYTGHELRVEEQKKKSNVMHHGRKRRS